MKHHLQKWRKQVESLPPGLSVTEAARRLKWDDATAAYRLRVFGYPSVDGRRKPWPVEKRLSRAKLKFDQVDWSMRNADIARLYNCSRERVGQVRKALGK